MGGGGVGASVADSCNECQKIASEGGFDPSVVHLVECTRNAEHFLEHHAHIRVQESADVPFRLWRWQCGEIESYDAHRLNIRLKTRGIGLTTLIAGYVLHKAMFRGWEVVIGSRSEVMAKKLLETCQYMRQSARDFVWMPARKETETTLEFKAGGAIISETAGPNMGTGYHPTLFILDEWSKIEQDEVITRSVLGAVGAKGRFVGFSTAFGMDNEFYRYWRGAERGENGFYPRTLHWQEIGEADPRWRGVFNEDWYVGQVAQLNNVASAIAEELDCDFQQSGQPVFRGRDLDAIFNVRQGMIGNGPRATLPDERVLIAIDPASGESKGAADDTSIDVLDGGGRQVHHEQWQKPAPEARARLYALLKTYQRPVVLVEKNAMGQMVCDWLRGGPWRLVEVYATSGRDEAVPMSGVGLVRGAGGWHPWMVPKAQLVTGLQADVESHAFHAYASQTRDQMMVFERQGPDRYGAPGGQHDDAVMSLAWARWGYRKGWIEPAVIRTARRGSPSRVAAHFRKGE